MLKSINKQTVTVNEVVDSLFNAETALQFDKIISPVLNEIVTDELLNKVISCTQKLVELRFDFYLRLLSKFTQSQLQKDKRILINRLYSPVKEDVRGVLGVANADITPALDLLVNNEDNKAKVIEWLSSSKTRDELIERAKLCYIYISLKIEKRQIVEFEKLLLFVMEKDSKLMFDRNAGKLFTEILLSSKPFTQIEKMAYFHQEEVKEVEKLTTKVAELEDRCKCYFADSKTKYTEIVSLKTSLNDQTALIEQLVDEVDSLKSKLKASEDLMEYETLKFARDLKNSKIVYADKLKRRLMLEIDGMKVTIGYVAEAEKKRLQRRIENIEKILTGEGAF
ncbi:MAG: hypothetical protein FWG70_08130 [Oscillospiraceae bacterium]|nr:hypothetical protein [Oscillospiraceae bacterium]